MNTWKDSFREGIMLTLPLFLGAVPFGLAYGIFARACGMSFGECTFMSATVFAGTAQFAAVNMLYEGTMPLTIILVTLIINTRHVPMALSLKPYLAGLRRPALAIAAFGLVDESYIVAIDQFQRKGEGDFPFFIASAVTMYIAWLGSSVAGYLMGSGISDPLAWGLDFALPCTFICILISRLDSLRTVVIVVISGAVATGFALSSYSGAGLLAAIFSGVIADMLLFRQSGVEEAT